MNSADRRAVLVTGSAGIVCSAPAKCLAANGHETRRLVLRASASAAEFCWDPTVDSLDPQALDGDSAIVHLAGNGIRSGGRTRAQKEWILRNCDEGTRLIAEAVQNAKAKPRVRVADFAIGFCGDPGNEQIDEPGAKGTGFLPKSAVRGKRGLGLLLTVGTIGLSRQRNRRVFAE